MITLYGQIVRDTGRDILFVVANDRGDARAFGLCGEHWFGKRQVKELPREDGFDRIEAPASLVLQKAKPCQLCD